MTDNEKYVKRGQALIIQDDPQRHEEVAVANRNNSDTPKFVPRKLHQAENFVDHLIL